MPTDKRQRKNEGRQARLEQLRAEQAKARRNRIIATVLVIGLVVGLAAAVFSGGGHDEEDVAAGDDTTTTTTTTAEGGTEGPPQG
ncbi:MAG: hypothetical protein ACRD0S_02765, partial [Acidimicrobiales bacterium]